MACREKPRKKGKVFYINALAGTVPCIRNSTLRFHFAPDPTDRAADLTGKLKILEIVKT